MKKLIFAAALLAGASLWVGNVSGHGGTYRGPGDTVPPGAGGGGGGGAPPAGGPGPGGGPTTGGGAGPTSGPITGGPARGGPTGGGPTTGQSGGSVQADLDLWSFWWEFNKDRYLNLQNSLAAGGTTTGDQDFFLGQGQREQAKDTMRPSPDQIRNTIVPALVGVLEAESNNDILTGAMIALAKIGDAESTSESPDQKESEFAKKIVPFLSNGTQEIAETAAVSLGILAHPSTIDLLGALMLDQAEGRKAVGSTEVDPRTRAFAGYGLGLVGSRLKPEATADRLKIVDFLATAIRGDRLAQPDVATAAMISMGLVLLEPGEAGAAPLAKNALPKNRQEQIQFAIEAFNNGDLNFRIRAHAPTAAGRLLQGMGKEFEALRILTGEEFIKAVNLSSLQPELRSSAALALGLIGNRGGDKVDADIRKALDKALSDGQHQVKNFALIALGKIGARAGSDTKADGRNEIEKTLASKLARGTNHELHFAALSFGVMAHAMNNGTDTISTSLVGALLDKLSGAKSPDDVGALAIAAGMVGDAAYYPVLLKKLDEISADEPRGYVAVALGLARVNEAREKIQKIVSESEYRPELLKQAAIALGLLGDQEIVDDLLRMLRDAKGLSAQAAISSALGFIGDRRSVDPLVEMLQNKSITNTARGFAAVALGIVADKEDLPWNSKIGEDLNYRAATATLNDSAGTGILNIL